MTSLHPSEPGRAAGRPRRPAWWVAAGLLAGVLAVGGLWVFLGRGEGEWDRYVRELEGRGETLEWKAFLPPAPPPDAENFAANSVLQSAGIKGRGDSNRKPALLGLDLRSALGQTGNWTEGQPVDLIQVARLAGLGPAAGQVWSRADAAAALLGGFESASGEVEELRRAALRPGAQLDLARIDVHSVEWADLVTFRELAQLFTLRAVAEVELGRTDEALADLRVVHRLADTLGQEASLVQGMVGAAILGLAPQGFWEGWVAGRWSEAQLREFERIYAGVDLLRWHDRAMRGERAAIHTMLEGMTRPRLRELLMVDASFRGRLVGFSIWLSPDGFVRANRLTYHRLMDGAVFAGYDVGRGRVFPRLVAEGGLEIDRVKSGIGPANWLAAVALPNAGRALETVTRNQMMLRLAATASMLERHRRERGEHPERLEDLVPGTVATLPLDLITGAPPHYRRSEGGGFMLYCVGWDERDDRGDPAKDWVWPTAQAPVR